MSNLAVQLYTVRDYLKTEADFAESLRKIAAIGYRAVQLSAVGAMDGEHPPVSAPIAKRMLDDLELSVPATHRDWNRLLHHTDAEIEFHKTLNAPYVAIGGIPNGYDKHDPAAYRRFIADAQLVIAALEAESIAFGFHNHATEFLKYDGKNTLWDILIEEGGDNLMLEIDLYWAWHAGCDTAALLQRMNGRVPVIHLKDKQVVADSWEPVMAAIGEGNLPWDAVILPACADAGVKWYCVEQDTCRRDPFDCLRSSFEFLRERGLS